MPNFDHFGFIAPLYDRLFHSAPDDSLARLLGLPVEGKLLDAGGGTGRVAAGLTGRTGGIVLADMSLPMLRQARAKPGLSAVAGAAERLPFATGSFERVIMVDAFHHVIDQPAVAAELLRVLAPGGRLVIEEPDVRRAGIKLLAMGEKLLLMRSHFMETPAIAALFPADAARVELREQGHTAWVVVNKTLNAGQVGK